MKAWQECQQLCPSTADSEDDKIKGLRQGMQHEQSSAHHNILWKGMVMINIGQQ